MRIVVGMATFKGREGAFSQAYDSLINQVDAIHVYDNSKRSIDLTDNGKFAGLLVEKEPCIYFTCDDDIIYPKDYIKRMTDKVISSGCIVSAHGRILSGLDVPYYTGHKFYHCISECTDGIELDVVGTGVTAFNTEYFNPVELVFRQEQKISDLLFSYLATKQSKRMELIGHDKGWIKTIEVDRRTTIYNTERLNQDRQIQIANEIWQLKK